jgi:hypothetical protein
MFLHTGSCISPFLHYSMLPVSHRIESHDTMVAKHVQEMMTEAPHDSPMGQLIQTSIEQEKLELGREGRLFDHNFKTVGHLLTQCWIKKCMERNRGVRYPH